MRLLDNLRGSREAKQASERAAQLFSLWNNNDERLLTDFRTYAEQGYQGNGPVFSIVSFLTRTTGEIDFKFQDLNTKKLFGNSNLRVLERPQPTWRTDRLVQWMELDRNIAGNAYVLREGKTLRRLRPDWVDIVVDPSDHMVMGYLFYEGGKGVGEGVAYSNKEVAHYLTDPDPLASARGITWMHSAAREIDADTYMSRHKIKYFTNAATPNLIVKVEGQLTPESREKLRAEFAAKYGSFENAYKTAILDSGADITSVGNNFAEMSYGSVAALGENRLANAAGVPPIVLGFSRGLDASTYSNYHQAMRAYADTRARPNWRAMSAALEVFVPTPVNSRLWYDDRGISFLQQDAKDESEIRRINSQSITILVRDGFSPDSAIEAVTTGDFSVLEHTGLTSVQLQPPMAEQESEEVVEDGA